MSKRSLIVLWLVLVFIAALGVLLVIHGKVLNFDSKKTSSPAPFSGGGGPAIIKVPTEQIASKNYAATPIAKTLALKLTREAKNGVIIEPAEELTTAPEEKIELVAEDIPTVLQSTVSQDQSFQTLANQGWQSNSLFSTFNYPSFGSIIVVYVNDPRVKIPNPVVIPISSIPEPPVFLLLIAGFAAISFKYRRLSYKL